MRCTISRAFKKTMKRRDTNPEIGFRTIGFISLYVTTGYERFYNKTLKCRMIRSVSWVVHLLIWSPKEWQWGYSQDWYDGPIYSFGLGPLFTIVWMDDVGPDIKPKESECGSSM